MQQNSLPNLNTTKLVMIKFNKKYNGEEEQGINMMPLIDIIFNLLIFFMITAAISTKGINLDLPEAESSEKLPSKSWEIIIDDQGKIILNDTSITLARLKEILKAKQNSYNAKNEETIVLKSNRNVPFGLFVKIMDSIRKSGFNNLVIATDNKKSVKRQ
jgi:biopolymer transport protein ExbD